MNAKNSKKPATFVESFHSGNICTGMEYHKLGNTDMYVSRLGFGASALGSVFGETDDAESSEVVQLAIKSGINFIDTAPWYGQGKSEEVLGQALKTVPRGAYYIATKVGRYEKEPSKMFDFSFERTLQSIDESLARLDLKYVDLLHVHDVEFAANVDIIIEETLPALQRIKAEGKARYIGITGYSLSMLKEITERSKVRIDCILTYCRYTMNDTTLLRYKDFFGTRGTGIINAAILSMGLLSDPGPPKWHPAVQYCPDITKACQEAAEYCQSQNVNISRLAIHFSLSLYDCSTSLVSTANREQLLENIGVISHPLTGAEKTVLDHVREVYMKPLNNANWEGLEVEQYWKELTAGTDKSLLG